MPTFIAVYLFLPALASLFRDKRVREVIESILAMAFVCSFLHLWAKCGKEQRASARGEKERNRPDTRVALAAVQARRCRLLCLMNEIIDRVLIV